MSNISTKFSQYYDFPLHSSLEAGETSFKIYRADVHPPKEKKVKRFKSIYSIESDDTSCYGSDSCSSEWDNRGNDNLTQNLTETENESSYRVTLNKWKLMEQREMKEDGLVKEMNNGFQGKHISNSTISSRQNDAHNSSSSVPKLMQTGEPSLFKNTDLNEFLKDIDKIADCNLARHVISEDGKRHDNSDLQRTEVLIRPSPQRWLILILICISVGTRSFVSVLFGQINDIFSTYFSVDANAVDWLTNASSVMTLLTMIGMIAAGGKLIQLRPLCLAMMSSAAVGMALMTAAAVDQTNGYTLALIGQIAMGFNNAIVVTITPIVAATWFPDGQVASALSATFVSVGVGQTLGSYLPGVALFGKEIADLQLTESSGGTHDMAPWRESEEFLQYKLALLFAIPTSISACVFLLSAYFFEERPLHPPSEAQAHIRERLDYGVRLQNTEISSLFSISRSSIEAANEVMPCEPIKLFQCKSFAHTTFVYGVVAASASTSTTLLSSILFELDLLGQAESADSLSGKIMGVMWLCFAIGPFIAGVVMDRSGKYRETAIVSISGLMIGNAGIPISLYLNSVTGLYFSHALTGLFMGAAETTFFEIAAEITYPSPELSFASILNVSWITFFIIYPVVGRIVFDAIPLNAGMAYLCPTVFNVISSLVTIFAIRPIYKRREGNGNEDLLMTNERTALLR